MPVDQKSNLAIIPARGGSKRIPGKNIRMFLGHPMISYSIRAALGSGLFDQVMVSTDSEEIAEVALKYGAQVPFFRSSENSDDYATTSAVITEVLLSYLARKEEFQDICCIYPCAPFVTKDIIQQAAAKKRTEGFDCIIPVIRYGFPIWRSVKMEQNGSISMIWPENAQARSQDLTPAFHDAGQFYYFDGDAFLKSGNLWSGKVGGLEVSELQAQDIDNESDWKLAALKYQMLFT